MISGDPRLLQEDSGAAARLALQRAQVERLDAFVWPQVHSRRQIAAAARENHYDVVTAQDPFWRGLLAWRIARRAHLSLNIQVHADLAGQSYVRRRLATFVLRRADTIRVVSDHLRAYLDALEVRARVAMLPIYIDVGHFSGLTRAPHAGKTLLWIGRFEEEKDPLAALAILASVRAAGVDARLIMLGSGSLGRRLRDETEERGLPVEFPGWEDPAAYLARADLVLCTSRHESYGASVIEALAAGVAVAAPDVGVARTAGAIIAPRAELGSAVVDALRSGARGALKLHLPSAEEWAKAWRAALV